MRVFAFARAQRMLGIADVTRRGCITFEEFRALTHDPAVVGDARGGGDRPGRKGSALGKGTGRTGWLSLTRGSSDVLHAQPSALDAAADEPPAGEDDDAASPRSLFTMTHEMRRSAHVRSAIGSSSSLLAPSASVRDLVGGGAPAGDGALGERLDRLEERFAAHAASVDNSLREVRDGLAAVLAAVGRSGAPRTPAPFEA